jgi:hypothetical protein
MTSSRCVALAVALAGALAAAPGWAQQHAPSAQDLETARTLYKEGKELRAAGDLPGAIAKLQAAHALGNTPVTGIELARTYATAGKLVEAREVALQIARIPVASDETEKSTDARAEAAKLAEDLRPRIPTLTARVSGVGADEVMHVSIDGAAVPDVAVREPQKVNPGKHEVVVRVGDGPAAREARAGAEAAEGQAVAVIIDVPAAPALLPSAPPPPAAAPATPEPAKRQGMPALEKVGFGVAIAGGAIGLLTGLGALERKNQLGNECNSHQHCDTSNNGAADLDAAHSWATISTVSFVVAAAGAATGIIVMMTDHRASSPPAEARVAPWLGPGMAGVNGHF